MGGSRQSEPAHPGAGLAFLLLLAPLLLYPARINAQINPEAGAFFSRQYLPETYSANPQNWAAAQDGRGVMFFGNTDGILEYDGAHWTRISLNNQTSVRSLAVDEQGTVYVGGQGEFGYLSRDAAGTVRYVSLLDRVPPADRHFGDVWTISSTSAGVVFGSYQRIFRWSPASGMKVWRPPAGARFGRVFTADGIPYVVVTGSGLHRIVGEAFETVPGGGVRPTSGDILEAVPGGDLFQQDVSGVVSYNGSLLVASQSTLYRQTKTGFVKYTTDADTLLREDRVYTCVALNNDDLAIGTVRGGLVLLGPDKHIDRIINKQSGLASNSVTSIYKDRSGSLWLTLARGIAHLEIRLPITRFGDREGLEEIVLAIQRQGQTLYAGTMVGLQRLKTTPGATAHFEPVSDVQGQVFALLSTPHGLLLGGQYGMSELTSSGVRKILNGSAIDSLSRSIHDPNLVFAAGRRGLFLLRLRDGQWDKIREIPSDGQDFLTAIEDQDGRIWATTRASIWRIDLSSDPASVERFSSSDGVPDGWNSAFRIQDTVLFGTEKGLLHFDNARRKFVPDTRFGAMFADGSHTVYTLRESATGDVWISGEGYHGVLHRNSYGRYVWDLNPLARSGIKQLWALHLDPDNVVWASGADGGLVRYTVWTTSAPAIDFRAIISSVQLLRNGSVLFDGEGTDAHLNKIKHQQNALRFQFAAPLFEDESRNEYQVRLEGLDRGWSEWSSETRKEYTNLLEGPYVFHVRARDLHGRISREAIVKFRVLPPWFRTWYACVLYALVLVGCIWLIVRLRLRALAESNRKLERIIEERTEQIRQQRDEIQFEEERTEALLLNILPAAVADELRTTGTVQPTAYDGITVCFTDFVGFTLSSESVSAPDLVAALHKYFTAFDEIVGKYGLEKLKTIGDSYMFVGGLPERNPSHAVDVVLAALEIVDVVNSFSESFPSWKVRVGVHSGPVVAGVVGVKKFAFDIWGETVNFASRFESSGAPNRVNISARTNKLVCEFIDCEPRGLVRIKEGRQLEMYFARQIREELLAGDSDGIPSRFAELYHKRFGTFPSAFPSVRSKGDASGLVTTFGSESTKT